MARIRTIKPQFFRHVELYEAEQETGMPLRVAFAGLWTAADRDGRFRWNPRELKLDCLPHDTVDFSRVLDALATRGFIVKYEVAGRDYGHIPSWHDHQVINNRETASEIPKPPTQQTNPTRAPRVTDACPTRLNLAQGEGKGREGKEESKEQPAAASGSTPEADLYRRGREVLGRESGGLIKKLLTAKAGSIAQARAAIETASEKSDPREYIGGILKNGAAQQDQFWDPKAGIL